MIERLTRRAREAVTLAQDEASSFSHDYVDTGHLLLGLLREGDGVAARALAACGAETEEARSRLAAIVDYGEEDTPAKPFSPPAKKVLATALQEARRLGNDRIGTGHLLIALASEPEGVAAKILTELGIGGEALRARVLVLMHEDSE
jgi:ATP-dependent Clp protease ATP-binding subunit ClpC